MHAYNMEVTEHFENILSALIVNQGGLVASKNDSMIRGMCRITQQTFFLRWAQFEEVQATCTLDLRYWYAKDPLDRSFCSFISKKDVDRNDY